jgi:hypothetical protein
VMILFSENKWNGLWLDFKRFSFSLLLGGFFFFLAFIPSGLTL